MYRSQTTTSTSDRYRALLIAILNEAFNALMTKDEYIRLVKGKKKKIGGYMHKRARHWFFTRKRSDGLDYETLCEFLELKSDQGRLIAEKILRARRRGQTRADFLKMRKRFWKSALDFSLKSRNQETDHA